MSLLLKLDPYNSKICFTSETLKCEKIIWKSSILLSICHLPFTFIHGFPYCLSL